MFETTRQNARLLLRVEGREKADWGVEVKQLQINCLFYLLQRKLVIKRKRGKGGIDIDIK